MMVPEPESATLFGSREKMVVGYVDESKGLTLAYCEDGASVKLVGKVALGKGVSWRGL